MCAAIEHNGARLLKHPNVRSGSLELSFCEKPTDTFLPYCVGIDHKIVCFVRLIFQRKSTKSVALSFHLRTVSHRYWTVTLQPVHVADQTRCAKKFTRSKNDVQ